MCRRGNKFILCPQKVELNLMGRSCKDTDLTLLKESLFTSKQKGCGLRGNEFYVVGDIQI